MKTYPRYRVAAMHVAPIFLDTAKTVAKTCALIEEAADHGARLIAFPETFISAFPIWSALRAPLYNHDYFRRLAAQTVRIPGPEISQIAETAKKRDVFVSVGLNEGTDASDGCIWNTNVLIGNDGKILVHHRKIVPTFWEKLVWANGDGAGLRTVTTPLGRVGMLICGENTNPLARFALIAQGEQVHVSSFPPVWPAMDPRGCDVPYDVADAIRIRTRNHAFEGKLFNIVSAGFMDKPMQDALAKGDQDLARILEESARGVSLVIGPMGSVIGKELQNEEGIVYAEIDTGDCVVPRQLQDVAGYYNRFDIFKFSVDRTPNRPIAFTDQADAMRASAETAQVGPMPPAATQIPLSVTGSNPPR